MPVADVVENAPAGRPLLRLSAVDLDSGPNGKVRYAFVGRTLSNHGDLFTDLRRERPYQVPRNRKYLRAE